MRLPFAGAPPLEVSRALLEETCEELLDRALEPVGH